MDIQNIVTDQDIELLDAEIDEFSISMSAQHNFSCANEDDLESLIGMAMKLGEMYERKKWQEKGSTIPDGFVLVPKEQIKGYFSHDGDNYQVHKSLNQAKNDAQGAIDYYSDRLADGDFHPESDGNYQDIGFGVVLGRSDYSLLRIITQQDIDNGECEYPVGTEILELHLDEAMIEAAEVGE